VRMKSEDRADSWFSVNAVFHFSWPLTSDMIVSRIGGVISQGVTVQYIRMSLLDFSRVCVGKAKNSNRSQKTSKLMTL
jgi:hypothetical protein